MKNLTTQLSISFQIASRLHWLYSVFAVVAWLAVSSPAYSQDTDADQTSPKREQQSSTEPAEPGLQLYQQKIKPLIATACFDCHSGDDVEGNFHADQLDPNLVGGKDTALWLEVYSVISKSEMPPDSDDLPDDQRSLIVDWLSAEIQAAEKMREANQTHSSFRRLTRYEYDYALQDLLGLPWDFAGDLPIETTAEGAFENNAQTLSMSVKQLETYHQLAVSALQRATVRGEQPPVLHWSIAMKTAIEKRKQHEQKKIESTTKKFKDKPEELVKKIERQKKDFLAPPEKSHYLDVITGERTSVDWHYRNAPNLSRHSDTYQPMPEPRSHLAVIQPGSKDGLTVELDDSVPDQGTLRIRIRASRAQGVVQRVPTLRLSFGFRSTDQGAAVQRVSRQDLQIDAPYDQPKIYQWDIPLDEIQYRNPYRGESKPGDVPSPSEYLLFTNSTLKSDDKDSESCAVLIEHIEIATPVYQQWPPQSHRSIFFESENSENETVYAREVISAFMARAWHRTPTASEVDRKLRLFDRLRPNCEDTQDAIIEVLATVLTSPNFLYVMSSGHVASEPSTNVQLSQNELATRLSLYLWCSLPDQTLLDLAAAEKLDDPEILKQQVDRMLNDPRADRFHKHFVEQWLTLQPLDFLSPSKGDQGIDAALLESMKQEPIALFADMLSHNSSVLEFINSDYSVVNERLANHYGIPDVQGNHFRRVASPQQFHRGGILTQAGMLTMNSDGTDSHPVKRGVWLLTDILNDPPPPPPAAVPEIDLTDPEILKLTLKQRIEKHRDHAACLSCHQKIDPWGIAFENYDALGRWRDHIDDQAVDATSDLPGDVTLDGVAGLKEYLLENRSDQFLRAMTEKMASFALGRQLGFGDRSSVTGITEQVRESGDGLKTLVFCLVTSELFQSK